MANFWPGVARGALRPQDPLARFVLTATAALLALLVPWYALSPLLAAPVVGTAGELMLATQSWVQGYRVEGTVGVLLTSLRVLVPHQGHWLAAELVPEVDYRSFGYGLVLLWALLLASRPVGLWRKLALGTLVLVPSQVAGLCFRWLRVALLDGGPQAWAQTGWPRWVMEVLAYGDQFGFLVMTPLVPVLLWLALDPGFARRLWTQALLAGSLDGRRG